MVKTYEVEKDVKMNVGDTTEVRGYSFKFQGVQDHEGPNYTATRAHVALLDGGKVSAMLTPENRFYPVRGEDMTNTAIRTTGLRDLYLALGDDRGNGRYTLRAYVSPLAPLIWIGGLVMALGGLLSLVGRLRNRAEPVPAAEAVAAE